MDIESLTGYGLVAAGVAVLVLVLKRIPAVRSRSAWLAPILAVVLGGALAAVILGPTGETTVRGLVCGAVAAWGYDAVAGVAWRRRGVPPAA